MESSEKSVEANEDELWADGRQPYLTGLRKGFSELAMFEARLYVSVRRIDEPA